MRRCVVILLGGARRVTLVEQFIELLQPNVEKISFISIEKDNGFYPVSAYADIVAAPKYLTSEFDDFLAEILADCGGDSMVVPCMDAAIPSVSALPKQKNIIAHSISGANMALNKKLTAEFCLENKISHPAIFSFDEKFSTKSIVKPIYGFGGKGISVVENSSFIDARQCGTHLIQEFIEGPETTHDVYITAAGDFFSSSRDRLAVIDGEVDHCIVRPATDSENDIFKCIAKSGLFHGPITVQTIHCNGIDYLIEINARLGGGVTASIAAGHPVIEQMVLEAFGLQLPKRNFHKLEMKRARRDFYRVLA